MNKVSAAVENGAGPSRGMAHRRWAAFGRKALLFLLVLMVLFLSFSRTQDDAFDTAYWMEKGDARAMLEYRHLIQREFPYWLWQPVESSGIHIEPIHWLMGWDFLSATLLLFLYYRFLRELTGCAPVAFAGAFAFGTANCIWIYAGSGRLYSTSLLLAVGGYLLALYANRDDGRRRWLLACAAGALVCLAALFWMVHVFNAIGVGLLLLFGPERCSWTRRGAHFVGFVATGTVIALAITVSCLLYVQIPLEKEAISAWMASAGTQPMKFDALGATKAAFGQANGHLVMNELPYMVNGVLRKDAHIVGAGNFPWQITKFVLIWLLIAPTYVYPLWLLWKPRSVPRSVIFPLLVPVGINLIFGIGWLGTDVQRFMPTMPVFIALGTISAHDWMQRLARPRTFALAMWAILLFIAGCNLVESNLMNYRRLGMWAEEMKTVRHLTRPQDLAVNFGRDLPVTYQTMMHFYAGANSLTLTNDAVYYDWDSPRWKETLQTLMEERKTVGGRVFLMDRVVLGENPPQAAWSEVQHPQPTVKQFAAHVRATYCMVPGFAVGSHEYFEMRERSNGCPLNALPPIEGPAQ